MDKKLLKYETEIWIFKNYETEKVQDVIKKISKLKGELYTNIANLYYRHTIKIKEIKKRLYLSDSFVRQVLNEICLVFYIYLESQ